MVSSEKFWHPTFWSSILPMFQILNVFLIGKQYAVNPNVAFKKSFSKKKITYRESVLFHSSVYNFTTYSLTKLNLFNFPFRVKIAQSFFSLLISCNCMVNCFKSSIRGLQIHCLVQYLSILRPSVHLQSLLKHVCADLYC